MMKNYGKTCTHHFPSYIQGKNQSTAKKKKKKVNYTDALT